MKKIYCLLSAALAALCIASCTKAELTDNETPAPAGNVLTFTATQAEDGGADDVKTYITEPKPDGSYVIRWASGAGYDERIAVNGVKSNVAQMVEGTYNTKATFHVEMEPAEFYCAMNPTNLFGKFDAEAKTMEVYVNATANYKTTGSETKKITYDPLTSLIAAYSTTTDLTFHHLMAYYKLVVDGGETYVDNLIERVVVRQGGDTPNIAGVYTLTFSEDAITLAPKNLTKLISYFAPEEGLAMGTEMMIAVPALNFESGLIFTVYCKDGSFHSFSVPAVDLSQKAGKVISKTVTYNPQSGKIMTAADWEAFAKAANAASKDEPDSTALYRWVGNGTVTLGADITLPGDFTRVANEFNYTFDGNGHTITIEEGKHALFFTLGYKSVVKNLTTDGSIVGGSSADGVTVLANSLYGTVQDCTNNADITISKAMNIAAAPFGKAINHGVISNCVNNGAITVTCDATQANYNVYAGGIVARVNPSGVDGSLTAPAIHIVNCTNNGAIKVTLNNAGHKIGYAGYGGITGWVARNYSGGKYPITIFEGCTNTGAITVTNTDDSTSDSNFAVCLGGIMGIGWGNYLTAADDYHLGSPEKANNQNKIYFKNCTNSGKLTNNATSYCAKEKLYAKSYTGGIAGSMFGFESVFKDESQIIFDGCVNSGNISGFSLAKSNTSITRNGLMSVAGGLLGIGANVSFKNCTVTGQIGNVSRLVFATTGGIGVAAGKFRFDGCTFYPKLLMCRAYKTAKDNWALVASYPKYTGTTKSADGKILFAGGDVPAITGSIVKNCHLGVLGCSLNKNDFAWDYTEAINVSQDVGKVEGTKFNNLENTETFSVQGTDQSGAIYCGKTSDVTFTANTHQTSTPALTTSAPAAMALTDSNTYNY